MNEEKFTGKAKYYAKFRPSYPSVLIERLYDITHAERVADIGAGTGIFTEQLLEKPWEVTAVEPNTDMCRELLHCVGGKAEIVTASAEDTGLADHNFGLITTAQAFHWFDEFKFREECKRILTPDGYLAIIWNSRDKSEISEARDKIFLKYCPDLIDRGGLVGRRSSEESNQFLRNEYFSSVQEFKFDNPHIMSRDMFVGDALSRSHAPKQSDKSYLDFVTELRELFDSKSKYGKIAATYTTTCFLGKF